MSKKSRARTRALRRSQAATTSRSRLQRKADRVFASEREREASEAIGKVRAQRDTARHAADRVFDKAVADARSARAEAHIAVDKEYEEKRATILKAFAKDGIEADAA